MKKTLNRTLSMMLVLLMLVSMVPVAAFHAEALEGPSVKLTYDSNGGVEGADVVSILADEFYSLKSVGLPTHKDVKVDGKDVPVRFMGWACTAHEILSAGDEYPTDSADAAKVTADQTVYAIWGYDTDNNGIADALELTEADEYASLATEIEFDFNTEAEDDDVELYVPKNIMFYLTNQPAAVHSDVDDKPVVLVGWSTEELEVLASDAKLPELVTAVTADEEVELNAVWGIDADDNGIADCLENALVLHFDVNGGDASSKPIDVKGLVPGAVINVTNQVATHADVDGRKVAFAGWTTEKTDVILAYGEAAPLTVMTFSFDTDDTEDVTLYALWQYAEEEAKAEDVTLTYDANGGANAPAAVTVAAGTDVTISTAAPTREGFTFKGWSFTPDGAAEVAGTMNLAANTTIYAVWEAVPAVKLDVTLTYDANGGEKAPASVTVKEGEEVTISTEAPTREGYSFKGWSTTKDGAADVAEKLTLTADTTIYAVWEEIPQAKDVTLTYDANGGEKAPASVTVKEGEEVTISTEAPTREGYSFKGWSTTKDGAADVAEKLTLTADTTIYAVWEEIPQAKDVTLTYDANGGEKAPASVTVKEGEEVAISTEAPTREGYSYKGWSTTKDGAADVAEKLTLTADTTIYAVWEEIPQAKEVTLTYDANGGEKAPASVTVKEGEEVTISTEAPTREGYSFKGWSTTKDGAADVAEKLTLTADTTIYAVWEKIPEYTLSYDANGGSGAFSNVKAAAGTEVTVTETEPTREEHKFLGWSTTKDGKAEFKKGDKIKLDKDMTLYAVWEKYTAFTITYDANGGNGAPAAQKSDSNGYVTLSSTVPTREGYNFKGWFTAKTWKSSDGTLINPGVRVKISQNVTLYAIWEAKATPSAFSLIYDANGGKGGPGPVHNLLAQKGVALDTKNVPTHDSVDGKKVVFLGWSLNKDGKIYASGEAKPATITSVDISKDTSVFAVWAYDADGNGTADILENKVTLTYDANGGKDAPAAQTLKSGEKTTVSKTVPTREEYTFEGWSTTKDGAVAYKGGEELTLSANTTLYAVWKQNALVTYKLTFNANGGQNAPKTQSVDSRLGYGIINVTRDIPTLSGKYFAGWSTDPKGKVQVNPGNSIKIKQDTTLYAIWSDHPKTGDESNIGMWVGIMGVSALVIAGGAFYMIKKRRSENESDVNDTDDFDGNDMN